MAKFNDLSEDIVIEILWRIPADSLVQFKCVSKSWYFLIKSPCFKAKQLHSHVRAASNSDDLYILLRRYSSRRCLNIILSLLPYDEKMQPTQGGIDDFQNFLVNNGSLSLHKDTPSFEILGVCDGIICFNYGDDTIIIANLATRKLRILPECCNGQVLTFGFGYDPKTNDYKVVRVAYVSPKNDRRLPQLVEVYTFNSNSWREIDNLMEIVAYSGCFRRYWNGAYYWFGVTFKPTKRVIVLFDMTYEVFRYITMPDSCQGRVDTNDRLLKLNGSLALLTYLTEEEGESLDVWTMDEFEVNATLTKLMRIGPIPLGGVSMPLLFVNGDELLLENERQVVSYNLTTKHIKKLPIYGEPGHLRAWIYRPSLVNISSHEKFSISRSSIAKGNNSSQRSLKLRFITYTWRLITVLTNWLEWASPSLLSLFCLMLILWYLFCFIWLTLSGSNSRH